MECNTCFRKCHIEEGSAGYCGVRGCRDGKIVSLNYGVVTSIALDPIEKKPLKRFCSGSMILSVGSYGCNLRCPFCQNSEISWSKEAAEIGRRSPHMTPAELANTAAFYRNSGNIGVAFTYNEPLLSWEYIRDTAKILKEHDLKTVIVTNGTASLSVWEELSPYVDAMNIDLKGFTDHYYTDLLKGDRKMVMELIARAVKTCHVELTTLIIPGENDGEDEIREMTSWISRLKDQKGEVIGNTIPLHITRFFPRFHMTDRGPTDVGLVYHLAEVAREKLSYVYTGNC